MVNKNKNIQDSFEDIKFPYDGDKMFTSIQDKLNKKRRKKRMIWWIFFILSLFTCIQLFRPALDHKKESHIQQESLEQKVKIKNEDGTHLQDLISQEEALTNNSRTNPVIEAKPKQKSVPKTQKTNENTRNDSTANTAYYKNKIRSSHRPIINKFDIEQATKNHQQAIPSANNESQKRAIKNVKQHPFGFTNSSLINRQTLQSFTIPILRLENLDNRLIETNNERKKGDSLANNQTNPWSLELGFLYDFINVDFQTTLPTEIPQGLSKANFSDFSGFGFYTGLRKELRSNFSLHLDLTYRQLNYEFFYVDIASIEVMPYYASNSYTFLDLSLSLAYSFEYKKWLISPQLGITAPLWFGKSGSIINNEAIVTEKSSLEIQQSSKIMPNAGLCLAYKMNPKIYVSGAINYVYQRRLNLYDYYEKSINHQSAVLALHYSIGQ